jgi:hypothetical protein
VRKLWARSDEQSIDDALRDLPEAPAWLERATRLVEDWKVAHGKAMLSPEATRDLAGRVAVALIQARMHGIEETETP